MMPLKHNAHHHNGTQSVGLVNDVKAQLTKSSYLLRIFWSISYISVIISRPNGRGECGIRSEHNLQLTVLSSKVGN
jgi:hypothetical protein